MEFIENRSPENKQMIRFQSVRLLRIGGILVPSHPTSSENRYRLAVDRLHESLEGHLQLLGKTSSKIWVCFVFRNKMIESDESGIVAGEPADSLVQLG